MLEKQKSMARNDQKKLELQKIDIGEAALWAVEDLLPKANAKNIKIHFNIEENLFIRGMITGVNRILVNLIENAVRYGVANGNIWIQLYSEETTVKCSIKDDGIGIAPEHQEKIFHRFYRVDHTRTTEEESHTGLGLAMVKMLVESYDGTIIVRSELNKGTEVIVSLPQVFDEK